MSRHDKFVSPLVARGVRTNTRDGEEKTSPLTDIVLPSMRGYDDTRREAKSFLNSPEGRALAEKMAKAGYSPKKG